MVNCSLTRADTKQHVFEYIEGRIQNWVICPLKLLNLRMSLSDASVKCGQDHFQSCGNSQPG
jgi:hypothetical protein